MIAPHAQIKLGKSFFHQNLCLLCQSTVLLNFLRRHQHAAHSRHSETGLAESSFVLLLVEYLNQYHRQNLEFNHIIYHTINGMIIAVIAPCHYVSDDYRVVFIFYTLYVCCMCVTKYHN